MFSLIGSVREAPLVGSATPSSGASRFPLSVPDPTLDHLGRRPEAGHATTTFPREDAHRHP